MAASIFLKFLILKCDISRTIWRIEVSDDSLFCIFHALSFKPSDFELIKTTANDKYKNVYAKIYTSCSGRVTCKLSERKKVKGMFKRRAINIGDLVDESFKGSCIIKVYQVFAGTSKTITLSVEEIMVTDMYAKKSYFNEYEEVNSNESSSEED